MNKIRLTIIILILIFLRSTVPLTLGKFSKTKVNNAPTLTQPPTLGGFPVDLNGEWVGESSVALGDINNDSIDEIIIGDRSGKIHAYTGTGIKLWEYDTGNMAISGKIAIGDLNADGNNEIVVGAGSTFTLNAHGGLYVLSHTGALQCTFNTGDFDSNGWRDGVYSSPALADFDGNDGGKLEIVFGSWDAHIYMLNHNCSEVWRKFNRDTIWASPAVGDIDRDGFLDIVIGVDSHDEPDLIPRIYKGGRVEALDRFGNFLPGFPIHLDEVVYSSPALGDVNNDGWLEIVVGTGYYWDNPACGHPQGCTPGLTHRMYIFDHTGQSLPGWPIITGDYVQAAPALADLDNDGQLEIIANSADSKVHVWNVNGSEVSGWPTVPETPADCSTSVSFPTTSSPTVADLDGDGNLEVLLISNWEIVIWDRQGVQLTRKVGCNGDVALDTNYTVGGSPSVGDVDGDGDVDVIIGGANSGGTSGRVYAWDFTGSATDGTLPWPVFRRNETNLGRYPSPPTLSVSPSSIVILHEFGNASPRQISIQVKNLGEDSFVWSGITNDGDLSIAPTNGVVGSTPVLTQATLATNGLAKGIYPYDITFTGLDDGNPVFGSPATVPVTLHVVDTVYSTYLPVVAR